MQSAVQISALSLAPMSSKRPVSYTHLSSTQALQFPIMVAGVSVAEAASALFCLQC